MDRSSDQPSNTVELAGIALRGPVIVAAGTAGTLDEIGEHLDLASIGALTTKSITPEPRGGNEAWRVAPVKAGMLNAVGLANPGIDAFIRDWAPRIAAVPCPVFGSIAGFSLDDYRRVASAFDAVETMPAASAVRTSSTGSSSAATPSCSPNWSPRCGPS